MWCSGWWLEGDKCYALDKNLYPKIREVSPVFPVFPVFRFSGFPVFPGFRKVVTGLYLMKGRELIACAGVKKIGMDVPRL